MPSKAEIVMAQNDELKLEVQRLSKMVSSLQRTNGDLKDAVFILEENYKKLVSETSERLKKVHERFQSIEKVFKTV